MRNVYNHVILQLIHGLFQIPAWSGLSEIRIVLWQTPKRSRNRPTQKGIKQGPEDEKLQISTVCARNQWTAGILRDMEDS